MRKNGARWLGWLGVMGSAFIVGCAASNDGAEGRSASAVAPDDLQRMAPAFHVRRAAGARAFVVLLPGASGLTIFEDSEHYFRAAENLSHNGFDVIVVDYKAAYRAAERPPRLETGGKIAWVVERAIEWGRREGVIGSDEPGAIVAWSLGGEGLWELVGDRARLETMRVRAAAAYYPSPEGRPVEAVVVPLLVLTGDRDDVTKAGEIRAKVEGKGEVQVRVYSGARHGFDVETIREAREIRLLPLFGPSATFQFDEAAAREAGSELSQFLRSKVR
ncbi:MAG: dienelactone hydrolase family protein [Phycisphaerales bacterium]